VITFGHSKDHRLDLKQLVWILTVAADGAVPVAYRLTDGNTNDDPTHVPTWDGLVNLLGRADFLYVADAKLASTTAMGHIAARGGRFVTVLPRTRSEDKWFRDWAQTHTPDWVEAIRKPGAVGEPDQVYSTFPAPLPTAEGFRVIWVHSTTKAACDAATRQARIEAGAAAIDAIADRLAGPKCRLKTRVAVEQEATAALARAGASRWITFTVTETVEETFRQERRGRPGAGTRYRRHTRTRHTISFDTQPRTPSPPAQGRAARRPRPAAQPGPHRGAVLLPVRRPPHRRTDRTRDPHRYETASTADIPLYPELRACPAPSAERILEIFTDLTRHQLHHNGSLVQTFDVELNPLQKQALDLLGVPATSYTAARAMGFPPFRGHLDSGIVSPVERMSACPGSRSRKGRATRLRIGGTRRIW
jgi:hypothetical protein